MPAQKYSVNQHPIQTLLTWISEREIAIPEIQRPFVWDATKRESGAGAGLDRVEREDEAVVESVQRGVRSRLYDRGRYSPAREGGVHHFHRLLAEFMRT